MENKQDICRCCLQTSIDLINIEQQNYFADSVTNILDKYFWFESKHLNELSNFICSSCWHIVQQFHTFILRIQDIHTNPSSFFPYVKIECEDFDLNKDYLAINDDQCDNIVNKSIIVSSSIAVNDNAVAAADGGYYDDDEDDDNVSVKDEPEKESTNEYSSSSDEIPNAVDSSSDENNDVVDDIVQYKKSKKQKPKKVLKKKSKSKKLMVGDSENEKKTLSTAKRMEQDKRIFEFFQIKCNECGIEELTLLKLKAHVRSVHNKKSFIICCQKKLFSRYEVLDHLDRHVNPNAFKCPTCNKIYTDRKGLRLHLNHHRGKTFVCDLCGKRYAHKSVLTQHMRIIHITQNKQEYICKDCGKSFRSHSVLQAHIRGVHQNANLHICDICAKLFKSKEQLNKHHVKHGTGVNSGVGGGNVDGNGSIGGNGNNQSGNNRNVITTKVQCPICGVMLSNDHLKRHIKSLHMEKPCPCPICGKMSPNKQAMRSHRKYVHFEQRRYQCTLCDKAFKRPIDLKQHVVSHTGLDAFTCSYCPSTFNCRSNMYKHRKRLHPEEWLRDKMK